MPICEADQLEEQYWSWLPHLPPSRQEKLLRYRFSKDRWLCAAAYMLLLYGLQKEYGISENGIVMECAESGKPYLSSHSHIYFSFSHCDVGVACGISTFPIGVDVESMQEIDNYVVKRVLSVNEQNILTQSVNPMLTFTAIWTLKESWVKATGCGLSYSLIDVRVNISTEGDLYIYQNEYEARLLQQQSSFCLSACWLADSNIEWKVCEINTDML